MRSILNKALNKALNKSRKGAGPGGRPPAAVELSPEGVMAAALPELGTAARLRIRPPAARRTRSPASASPTFATRRPLPPPFVLPSPRFLRAPAPSPWFCPIRWSGSSCWTSIPFPASLLRPSRCCVSAFAKWSPSKWSMPASATRCSPRPGRVQGPHSGFARSHPRRI